LDLGIREVIDVVGGLHEFGNKGWNTARKLI
jgi:hypothetical protein